MRRWKLVTWLSGIVLLLSVLLVAPYLVQSTEIVRIRNALLLVATQPGDFDWTPETVPAGFMLEQGPSDPYFVELAAQLELTDKESDWDRAIAISRHLLSHPALNGMPIQSDLRGTHKLITDGGDGYCGDFTRAFMALSIAGGTPVRAWAFSFDGFGGHGHILPEIWNRQLRRWQLVDVFDNYYFHRGDGVALSAAEFRAELAKPVRSIVYALLSPDARPGYVFEDKAWDYFRRGLPEWYLVWGNNVFTYDRAVASLGSGNFFRSLEQISGILLGVSPRVKLLETEANRSQVSSIWRLRIEIFVAALGTLCGVTGLLLAGLSWRRARHEMPIRK